MTRGRWRNADKLPDMPPQRTKFIAISHNPVKTHLPLSFAHIHLDHEHWNGDANRRL
jgi:hypothetical protein